MQRFSIQLLVNHCDYDQLSLFIVGYPLCTAAKALYSYPGWRAFSSSVVVVLDVVSN